MSEINGHDHDATPPEPVECSRCGHVGQPWGKGQCEQCKCWLPKNDGAVTHGLRRYQETGILPPDLRGHLDEFEASLVSDLGGDTELSTLARGLVGNIVGLEAQKLLLLDFAFRTGADTKRGREALADYRATADSYLRTAKTLGLERRSRRVSPEDWVAEQSRESAE